MLILSRKVQEEIMIGDDIRVRVTRIQGSRVHIGVSAPASYLVLRGELKRRGEEHNKEEGDESND